MYINHTSGQTPRHHLASANKRMHRQCGVCHIGHQHPTLTCSHDVLACFENGPSEKSADIGCVDGLGRENFQSISIILGINLTRNVPLTVRIYLQKLTSPGSSADALPLSMRVEINKLSLLYYWRVETVWSNLDIICIDNIEHLRQALDLATAATRTKHQPLK